MSPAISRRRVDFLQPLGPDQRDELGALVMDDVSLDVRPAPPSNRLMALRTAMAPWREGSRTTGRPVGSLSVDSVLSHAPSAIDCATFLA